MTVLALALSGVVGIVLGAVGGGGAVLMVPVLVVVAGQPIHEVTITSLLIVAVAAAAGTVPPARAKRVAWRVVGCLVAAAIPGSYAGAVVKDRLDGGVLTLAFTVLLLVIAGAMWHRAGGLRSGPDREPRWGVTASAGAATGLLTGMFGVGGGFLILPTLVLVVGLPLRQAVGTSLAAVSLVSTAALAAHGLRGGAPDLSIAVPAATAVLAGVALGGRVARRMTPEQTLRGFAGLLTVAAVALLAGS